MSVKTSKEIECLARLDTFISSQEMILDFLQEEALISKEERRACQLTQDKAKWLWTTLSALSKKGTLQLLEYSWEVLPVERLKVVIVTDRNNREFAFGY